MAGDAYQTKDAPAAPVSGAAAAYAVPASPENKTRGVASDGAAKASEVRQSLTRSGFAL